MPFAMFAAACQKQKSRPPAENPATDSGTGTLTPGGGFVIETARESDGSETED